MLKTYSLSSLWPPVLQSANQFAMWESDKSFKFLKRGIFYLVGFFLSFQLLICEKENKGYS